MSTLRTDERFDVIAYDDLSDESTWTKLGQGSFGAVWKGEYLGLQVAIKEVLASTEYDVDKYFQRECLLMSSSRHPNIVQFLGLCRAPRSESSPRQRILIISEYLPRGNLRAYIDKDDKQLPFPWRLRLSFAIDLARALAYLHVRKCLHRDLKGENALVSENERIKITDFGFARIAPRNETELSRLSYCGTDGYMAPEILLGEPFGLPVDIFSLGILLIEICCRKLASTSFLVRYPPFFTLDRDQVLPYLSPGCPTEFVELALRCTSADPAMRPDIKEVLARLFVIEKDVLARELATIRQFGGGTLNVGTLSFAGTTRRARARPGAPRLPSFEGRVKVPSRLRDTSLERGESEEDDPLDAFTIADGPAIQDASLLSPTQEYSTFVLKKNSSQLDADLPSLPSSWINAASSTLTVTANDGASMITTRATINQTLDHSTIRSLPAAFKTELANVTAEDIVSDTGLSLHRFTLIKPGLQRFLRLAPPLRSSPIASRRTSLETLPSDHAPPAAPNRRRSDEGLLASLGANLKCGVCDKRLGVLKAWLECDDCSFKCHVKCSDLAEPACTSKTNKGSVLADASNGKTNAK